MSELPVDLRRVESRLHAVEAVDGVVHAIWALSRAQLAQIDQLALGQTTYLDWVESVVSRLAGTTLAVEAEDALRVIVGPERSFCGTLPRQILDAVPDRGRVGIVGRRLAEAVAVDPALAGRVAFAIPGPASVHELPEVSEAVAEHLLRHAADEQVELWYPTAESRALAHGTVLSAVGAPRSEWDFETLSSPAELLRYALAESVVGRVRVGLSEALRVEARARAAAAEQARHAVSRQRDALLGAMRVLQQEAITSELCELVAGRLQP